MRTGNFILNRTLMDMKIVKGGCLYEIFILLAMGLTEHII